MDKIKEITQNIRGMEIYESLIVAAIGLAVLLFGYRIKKIAFFIIWFLIGYNIMLLLMPAITSISPEVLSSNLFQILLPIAGGLLLALLGFSIEKLCVAGIVFFLVMMITVQYFVPMFDNSIIVLAVGAIIGVVLAALAVSMIKPAIIIATSVAGGWALTLAFLNIFPVLDANVFYLPSIAAFAVLGAIFQFATTKHMN